MRSGSEFWQGDLKPHKEHGAIVREVYEGETAVLLVDETGDFSIAHP
jgi:hypothetical protein